MPGFRAPTMVIKWPLRPSLSVVEDPWNVQLFVPKSPNTGRGRSVFHISKLTSMPEAGRPWAISRTWVVIGGRVLVDTSDGFVKGECDAEARCDPMMLTRSSKF